MGPVTGRDSQGTLSTNLCWHFVLAADSALHFLKPALEHQTGAVLAGPSWSVRAVARAPSTTPALTGQSEESEEGRGCDELPSQWKPVLGSKEQEGDGKGWGPRRGGRRLQAQQLLTLPHVLCSSTANTTVFNASALLPPNTNSSLVSPFLLRQSFESCHLSIEREKLGNRDHLVTTQTCRGQPQLSFRVTCGTF